MSSQSSIPRLLLNIAVILALGTVYVAVLAVGTAARRVAARVGALFTVATDTAKRLGSRRRSA